MGLVRMCRWYDDVLQNVDDVRLDGAGGDGGGSRQIVPRRYVLLGDSTGGGGGSGSDTFGR